MSSRMKSDSQSLDVLNDSLRAAKIKLKSVGDDEPFEKAYETAVDDLKAAEGCAFSNHFNVLTLQVAKMKSRHS